jgi:hypothetical protein
MDEKPVENLHSMYNRHPVIFMKHGKSLGERFLRRFPGRPEHGTAFAGEVKGYAAPVAWMAPAFYEFTFHKAVNHFTHRRQGQTHMFRHIR